MSGGNVREGKCPFPAQASIAVSWAARSTAVGKRSDPVCTRQGPTVSERLSPTSRLELSWVESYRVEADRVGSGRVDLSLVEFS